MSLRRNLLSKIHGCLPCTHKLIKDQQGVATIEFALIAPIMIAMYFGMSEISLMITADRQVAHATSVTGDLATQLAILDASEVSDVMTATLAVLNVPSNKVDGLTVELNSYEMDIDGTINRVGYARLGSAISSGGPATYDPSGLNTQIFNAQSGVVVARINYKYLPTTLKFADQTVLSETFIMKPRKSISVPFDENGVSSFTCSAATNLTVTCTGSSI